MVAGEDFDANIVARSLVQGEAIVVASPDYLKRRGIPREPQDLVNHDYLRDSSAPVRAQMGPGRKLRLQSLRADVPDEEVEAPAVLQSVSTELLMRAAVDGAGVAVTSRLLAEEHLARGELVHILPDWIFSRYTIYAALPSGRMLPARTRVFLDFLTEQVPLAMAEKRGSLS
jgi:DNA-binding transcriptional LysR family regulator